jgi:hypothetical protein
LPSLAHGPRISLVFFDPAFSHKTRYVSGT